MDISETDELKIISNIIRANECIKILWDIKDNNRYEGRGPEWHYIEVQEDCDKKLNLLNKCLKKLEKELEVK